MFRKKIYLLSILFFFIFVLASKSFCAYEVNMKADSVTYQQDDEIINASGNVEIKWTGKIIKADNIEMKIKAQKLQASGNVEIKEKDNILCSNNVSYDMAKEQGELEDTLGTSSSIYFSAKKMIKVSSDTYKIQNVTLSNCDLDEPHHYVYAKEGIFVYTFEALRRSADKTVYSNIHNVYDPDDLVAYLFPSQWGLGLNGVEETIGGGEKITGKIMCLGDDGSFTADYSQIGKAEFIERFSAFTARYMTRECYNAIIQEPLRDFVVMFFGKSYVDQGKLMRAVPKIAESFQSDERFIPAMMSLLAEPCNETVLGDTASLIFEHLDKIRHQDNLPLNDDETRIVKTTLRAFMTFLAPAVEADLCCAPEEGAEEVSFYHFMTFALDCGELLKAHVPESVLAAVKADDNYYSL